MPSSSSQRSRSRRNTTRSELRALVPFVVILAFCFVPPLRAALLGVIDVGARAITHSITKNVEPTPTSTTTSIP